MPPLSHARTLQILDYNPRTGFFTWRVRVAQNAYPGQPAGSIYSDRNPKYKRLYIQIDGKRYAAHRLAWFYMTGKWPSDEIDHIDRNPLNNKWTNLREVNRLANVLNGTPRGRSLPTGVRSAGRGRYRASAKKNGKNVELGVFPTPEAAHSAYRAFHNI
jgi:hypothetical protein